MGSPGVSPEKKPPEALRHPRDVGGAAMLLKSVSAVLRVGLIVVALAGCGLALDYPAPPTGSMVTLMPGWERYFSLQWTAGPEREGSRRLDGYVVSHYGDYAADLRLLVQSRDASDAVVAQRIVPVTTGVGGFGRAYFDIRNLPAADHYQVFVWDYRLVQAAELMR